MSGPPPSGSQTIERALRVLLEVGESGPRGLTLAECSAALAYSKPTTHRILRSLCRNGFLSVEGERAVYRLGIANLRLGMEFLDQLDLRREALPVLTNLAEQTRETAHLGILSGAEVVYIDKVESPQAVRMFSRVGHTMPAYSTGVGKAILAFLGPDRLEAALPADLEAQTLNTIVDRAELFEHLAFIRERGYSTDDVENEDGIRCVGAPVLDHTGAVCAGISVAGPATRVTPERFPELGELARASALAISRKLGYEPSPETAGPREAARSGVAAEAGTVLGVLGA